MSLQLQLGILLTPGSIWATSMKRVVREWEIYAAMKENGGGPNFLEDVLPREIEHLVLLELKTPAALACVARASKGLYERAVPVWKEHCRRLLAAVGPDSGMDPENPNAITPLREAEELDFPNAEALCFHVFQEASKQMGLRFLGCFHGMMRNVDDPGLYAWLTEGNGIPLWYSGKAGRCYFQRIYADSSVWDVLPQTRHAVSNLIDGYLVPIEGVWIRDALMFDLASRMFFVLLTDVDPFACFYYCRTAILKDRTQRFVHNKTSIREGLFSPLVEGDPTVADWEAEVKRLQSVTKGRFV
jgi:hypothetical protein